MIDKQIIIDGVDVSGCIHYQDNMCTATKDNYGDCSFYCKDYDMNDCYYKQLVRKKQECEELKESLKVWKYSDVQHMFKINKYEQTFIEIKEIAENAEEQCAIPENYFKRNNVSWKQHQLKGLTCKFKQILQKIRESEADNAR